MHTLVIFGLAIVAVQQCVAPPAVTKTKEELTEENHDSGGSLPQFEVHYQNYLTEVLQLLESDPQFRAKLQKADAEAIKSGTIADDLEFVEHKVRKQLDEVKRTEIQRLRQWATKEYEKEHGLDLDHMKIHEHLDHTNHNSFEIVDLKKLIKKISEDLSIADVERHEEFKKYEMKKHFEEEETKKKMNAEEKKKYEENAKALEEKHKNHEPLHHPGSKQQLKEVWEKQDHMGDQEFNAKTFFHLHDLDGNLVWDQYEIKALFVKELAKIYPEGSPDTDVRERAEEMERMREYMFRVFDLNKDNLISYDEYLAETKKGEFEEHEAWKSLDETDIYTNEEYAKYEREQLGRQIAKGIAPEGHDSFYPGNQQQFAPQHVPVNHAGIPHQDFVPPMGDRHPSNQQQQYHGQIPPHQQQFQGHKPQYQGQQNDIPQYQEQQNDIPQYQGQQNGIPQYQGQRNDIPQYQEQQNDIPQYQGQQNGIPQYQGQRNDIPQYQEQQNDIPQYQGQQNGIPQYQGQRNDIPQYQEYQQVPHYQAHSPQGQAPPPQYQQGQQQQQVLQTQQDSQRRGNVQGQLPVQQANIPVGKNQGPQYTGQNASAIVENAPKGGNVVQPVLSPNVVQI